MFTEYIMKHPVADGLVFPVKCPFPAMSDREAWKLQDAPLREQLDEMIALWADKPYPMLTAGDYLAYTTTGSRQVFEKPYFDRRRKLCAALIGACVSGDMSKLDEVIDGIWCICEETSWVISAHNEPGRFGKQPLPDDRTPRIDLFCAQTGMILALCAAMCGRELDNVTPLICDRIGRCLEERILIPFERTEDHWWMGVIRKDLNNWTPWIVSNVMLIACLRIRADKPRLAALLERACVMLDRYLDIMPEDGGCDEGMGYWNLAGGMLLDCAELLEYVTGGKMSFRDDRKFINILSYPRYAYLGNGWCVNFADCDARPEICGERIARAGEMTATPELISFGAAHAMTPMQYLSDTPQLWRLLNRVFHRLPDSAEPEPEPDTWLPDLQLRIRANSGVTLVCKAGHNGENHNHNDVGSFMIYADREPEVVDAGNMTYTAKTFSAERYTLWNTRGMYHNIPLIGGAEQQPGTERRARNVRSLPDGMELDMALCYPDETGIDECRRRLTAEPDGTVTVSDRIRTKTAHSVTWVFMTRHEPEITADAVMIGKLKLLSGEPFTASSEEIDVTDVRMARNFPGKLWRLTVTERPACEHIREFRFVGR